MPRSSLPSALDAIDLGAMAALTPEALSTDPAQLYDLPAGERAARLLKYSRVGPGDSYDEIGFRLTAANVRRGQVPLQTLHGVRSARDRERKSALSDPLTAIVEQEQKLRHRLMDLPDDTGRFRYRIEGRLLQLDAQSAEGDVETWTFPLSAPLAMLQHNAVPSDASPLITQQYKVDIPGSFWLPLSTVIRTGRFIRYQDWRDELQSATRRGHFFCFVSHRWLTPTAPDPDDVQAAFLSWQVFSHLCEAVRIARYRGLHQPRMQSLALGFTVGITGSELAEALLVNVLRDALDADSLNEAWKEAREVAALTDDYGAAAATDDAGLDRLRRTLADCPTLSSLLARVHVWYDYACMPQPPRTSEDEGLFRQGLQSLVAIQVLGHTVVLLDEAEDYLSRGWCTLEALVADTEAVSMDVLIGSARPTARDGTAEHYFQTLLQDRPHIVWRAVLDTEVFGIQTTAECLERLALAVTDPHDLPFIYRGLRHLRAPAKIHLDDSELFTGVYPVATSGDGFVLVPQRNERGVAQPTASERSDSIDWTGALRIESGWTPAAAALGTDPYRQLSSTASSNPRCHLAIVASCEGEAVLFANWSAAHGAALEKQLGVQVVSLSWLAADIAPVGHFVSGALQVMPVDAAVWVLIATRMRLTQCGVTGALSDSVLAADVRVWHLAIDQSQNNVTLAQRARSQTRRIAQAHARLQPHIGGLFRTSMLDVLFGNEAEAGTSE